jgi:hypothetical protein
LDVVKGATRGYLVQARSKRAASKICIANGGKPVMAWVWRVASAALREVDHDQPELFDRVAPLVESFVQQAHLAWVALDQQDLCTIVAIA